MLFPYFRFFTLKKLTLRHCANMVLAGSQFTHVRVRELPEDHVAHARSALPLARW
jgi:hypothetical protein